MKNITLVFGLGLVSLFAGCGSGGYIETVEEAEAYRKEIEIWGEDMKGVSDEDYFEATVSKICDCANKTNFDIIKDGSTLVGPTVPPEIQAFSYMCYFLTGLVVHDVRDDSDNSNMKIDKLKKAVKLKCPNNSDGVEKAIKFTASLLSE